MDIKVGNGSLFDTHYQARAVSDRIQAVAARLGVPTRCLMSNMDEPISYTVGNALEVREAIDFLVGAKCHPRLHSLVFSLASSLLQSTSLVNNQEHAEQMLNHALTSGRAAEVFAHMVQAMGGPADLIERPGLHLATAPCSYALRVTEPGIVSGYDMKRLGQLCSQLSRHFGAETSVLDHSVGVSGLLPVGTLVAPGTRLVTLHVGCHEHIARASDIFSKHCISIERHLAPTAIAYAEEQT